MLRKFSQLKTDLNNKIRSRVDAKVSNLKKVPEKVLYNIFVTSLNLFNSALREIIVSKGLDPNRDPGEEKKNDVISNVVKRAKYLFYTTGMPDRKPFPKLKESSYLVNSQDLNTLANKLDSIVDEQPLQVSDPKEFIFDSASLDALRATLNITNEYVEDKTSTKVEELVLADSKRRSSKKTAAKKQSKKTKK